MSSFRNERSTLGFIGVYGSSLGAAIIIGTLLIVFGPAKDSLLDRFAIQHIQLFRDLLWGVFFTSVLTFLLSLFGDGLRRGFGIVMSILNFLVAISILGAGE